MNRCMYNNLKFCRFVTRPKIYMYSNLKVNVLVDRENVLMSCLHENDVYVRMIKDGVEVKRVTWPCCDMLDLIYPRHIMLLALRNSLGVIDYDRSCYNT